MKATFTVEVEVDEAKYRAEFQDLNNTDPTVIARDLGNTAIICLREDANRWKDSGSDAGIGQMRLLSTGWSK
jgi:hypothetical protein